MPRGETAEVAFGIDDWDTRNVHEALYPLAIDIDAALVAKHYRPTAAAIIRVFEISLVEPSE